MIHGEKDDIISCVAAEQITAALRELEHGILSDALEYRGGPRAEGIVEMNIHLFSQGLIRLLRHVKGGYLRISHDIANEQLVFLIENVGDIPKRELCKVFEVMRTAGLQPSVEGDYIVLRIEITRTASLALYNGDEKSLSKIIENEINKYL